MRKVSIITICITVVTAAVTGLYFKFGRTQEIEVINSSTVTPTPTPELSPVSILTFGDIMLDRYIRQAIYDKGLENILAPLDNFITGYDIVLANLEGSFTDFTPKPATPNMLSFTFDPKQAPILRSLGINLVSLANNHSLNFGQAGLEQSRAYLTRAGIEFFGDPENKTNLSIVKEVRGLRIAFIGYHQLVPGAENITAEIIRLRPSADYVIVVPHWGTEYEDVFSKVQQDLAHQFIDAGADVVIGHHPHVIQPAEVYKKGIIIYSLGNFIFDQIRNISTRQGMAVKMLLDKQKMEMTFHPLMITDWQINLLSAQDSTAIFSKLASNSVAGSVVKEQLRTGKIILEK